MSIATIDRPRTWNPRSRLARIGFCVVAITLVAAGLAGLSGLLFASGAVPPLPARNPFGITLRDAAPPTTGFGGIILSLQAQFYGALTGAVRSMKDQHAAISSLATIGFLYGIFHAAGPGHGKGVISGYMLASKRSLRRGLTLSVSAALLQALVAIALVGGAAIVFKASAATINGTARGIESVSFAAVAAMGAVLVWTKSGQLSDFLVAAHGDGTSPANDPHDLPPPAALDRIASRRQMVWVVLAAGIRPCSGAIILLVFALSQNLFVAGVVGALSMALGTAITTGTLASAAVFAKAALLRMTAGRGAAQAMVVGGCELLAAAFVLVLGLVLLTGMWVGALPNALD